MRIGLSHFGSLLVAVAAAATLIGSPAGAVDCQNPQCRVMIGDSCLARRASSAYDAFRFQRSECGKQYQRYRDCVELVNRQCGDDAKEATPRVCSAADAQRRWSALTRSEDAGDLLVFADECGEHDPAAIARDRAETLISNRIAASAQDRAAVQARAAAVDRGLEAAVDYMPARLASRKRLEARLKDGWLVGHAMIDALGARFVYREEATRAICGELFEETCPGYVAVAPPVTFDRAPDGDGDGDVGGAPAAAPKPVGRGEEGAAVDISAEAENDVGAPEPVDAQPETEAAPEDEEATDESPTDLNDPFARTRRLFGN